MRAEGIVVCLLVGCVDPDQALPQVGDLTATETESLAGHYRLVDDTDGIELPVDTGEVTGLRDDFEHFVFGPWTAPMNGSWTSVYNGGELGVEADGGRVHYQRPPASTSPGETHADMVVSSESLEGDLDVRLRIKTVAQLRQGSTPNPWEVAWFGWNYQRAEQFYYFVGKPNGWELGKSDDTRVDPAGPECSWPEYQNCRYRGAQRFLATGTTPTFPIGVWYQLRVVQTGATIKVYVNGSELAAFTDDHNVLTSGRLALYNEDAWARFDDIYVQL